jgi:hypothetical protein
LQVFLDESDLPTTGKIITYSAEPFATADIAGTVNGTAPDVYVTTHAGHSLTIEAELTTGSGITVQSSWWQELNVSKRMASRFISDKARLSSLKIPKHTSELKTAFTRRCVMFTSAASRVLANNRHQRVKQRSWGRSHASHNSLLWVLDHFEYPLEVFLSFSKYDNPGGNQTFYDYDVTLNQTYIRAVNAAGISGMFHNFNVTQNGSGTQVSRHAIARHNGTQYVCFF